MKLPTWPKWFRREEPSKVSEAQPRHLYLFFDEAGDFNFRPNGTKHYLFGTLAIRDPWPLTEALGRLRRELFDGKFIPEAFHASEDRQATRDRVFECICSAEGLSYDVTIVDKAQVPEEYREESTFYTFVADFTLRMTLADHPTAQPVYLITDVLPVKRKRDAVVKGLKQCLAGVLEDREFEIGHHSAAAHGCLQAADYLNWAVFRKWERADDRSYVLVERMIKREVPFDWELIKK